MGESVDPCDDFFKFACRENSESYPGSSLKKIEFKELVLGAPTKFQFVKDFYQSCLASANISKLTKEESAGNMFSSEFLEYAKVFASQSLWPVVVGENWEQEVE